jgi:coiled-coil domain-containing protein 12
MSSRATLGAASDDRKARLAQLRSLKRKQPEDDAVPTPTLPEAPAEETAIENTSHQDGVVAEGNNGSEKNVTQLYLSGRNYDPETGGAKLGFEAPPTQTLEGPTLEEQAADVEEETRRQAAVDSQDKGIDLFKIQPKKPNWDLKRELNKKLEVLNVRTENAIARLVRERLQAGGAGGKDALPEGGNAGALEGAEIVEGIRLREREEEEEERRERTEAEMD